MPETPTLTAQQLSAVNLLASGMSQGETGKRVGVTRKTVNRWLANEEFKAEIERRRQNAIAAHQQAADQLQQSEIADFYSQLAEYRQARIQVNRAKISRGTKMLQKLGRRFDDLPEEAIAPANLAQMLKTADDLLESAFAGWAEILGLEQLMAKMNESQESGD